MGLARRANKLTKKLHTICDIRACKVDLKQATNKPTKESRITKQGTMIGSEFKAFGQASGDIFGHRKASIQENIQYIFALVKVGPMRVLSNFNAKEVFGIAQILYSENIMEKMFGLNNMSFMSSSQ